MSATTGANFSSEASTTTRTSDSSNMAMQSSSTLIGAVLGTVVALLVLLVLSLAWCVRKANRDKQGYNIQQPIEIGQHVDIHNTNAAVEMKTNAAYISSPSALQITTEENVAYAGCDYEQVDYDYVYDYVI